MKKPKKGKTNSSAPSSSPSQRSASQRVPAQSSPQVLHIAPDMTSDDPIRIAAGLAPSTEPESRPPPQSHVTTVARCQQLYAAAHTTDAAGRIQLDAARLAQSLADAGIGIRAEQELYSMALMAAADGHAALFEADVLAAIAKAS
jgi:hypothetical protein